MSDLNLDIGIFITDLLEKTSLNDTDWMLLEDTENTKRVMFRNMRRSLISDNEPAADYRIYSSQKISELVQTVNEKINDSIGTLQSSVDNVNRHAVTDTKLQTVVDEINKAKADKTTTDAIIQELENTRKKSEYITGKDIQCGSDDEKIHLDQLGTDVRDAMTGHTPVSVLDAPAGGWPAEDIANGSLTAKKFTRDYTYRGNIKEGDLNRIVESGVYEVAASVANLPHYGDDMNETRLVEVIRYGVDAAYIVQRAYYKEYTSQVRPYFERKGAVNKLAILEWFTHFEVTEENKVSIELLGDQFINRGTVTEGSVYDITADGNYLCAQGVTGLPTNEAYMVSVFNYGENRAYTAVRAETSGCIQYTSYIYRDTAGIMQRMDWVNITDISKSKFDGKYIHVFGDGISYGLGASVPISTSYTSILHFKYGWHLTVHALANATVGNYNEALAENSIITQIDTAEGLTTGDDFIALFFVGGEDYRYGLCDMGVNTYKGDTTFKGALNLAIDKLLTKAPQAKIMLVTPMYRASTNPGDNLSGDENLVNSKHLVDYVDAMKEIAELNHIPCLDLYNEGMINEYNSGYYLNLDGVYPNDRGHALLAEKIHDALCKFY